MLMCDYCKIFNIFINIILIIEFSIMKNIVSIVLFLFVTVAFTQNVQPPKFEKQGHQTKAIYFHENGRVEQEGYFDKQNKLHGTWTSYNSLGNKVSIGKYHHGLKVGKWLFWTNHSLKEVDFENNIIANVNEWQNKIRVATNH